jgi:hypothetical protein
MEAANAADPSRMKAVHRPQRLAALLALPLALWSAAPSIRWCWIAWEQFPECFAVCPNTGARPYAAGDDACAPGDAACAAGAEADHDCSAGACSSASSCDRAAAPTTPARSGDRTRLFCIGSPVGGFGVKPPLADASPQALHSLPVAALDVRAETGSPTRIVAAERARAPAPPRALRPPVRAPPIV